MNYSFNETQTTQLCEIMGRNKSDKGSSPITSCKHNYTTFYYSIFNNIKEKVLRIFELGLGTNNPNIPSSMGLNGRPGASLYGWNEFFPNSYIFGADIDENILFSTDKIKTYFCDQTKPDVINCMWKNDELKEDFDIIIEDGLHNFNANVCFFENSIHKLKPNGYFIIEDIIEHEKYLFENKIKQWEKEYIDCFFNLLTIPSNINDFDNTLLVVHKSSMDNYDAVKYILKNNINGAIVECGVENGRFELICIDELSKNNCVRDIYLYDTFSGLTKPSEHDYTNDDTKLFKMNKDDVFNFWKSKIINEKTNLWCYGSLDDVKDKLNNTGYPQERLHYIVGDVLETLKDINNIPDKIAILRLDTDWYESSKFELEKFYDNVLPGGLIIFDDYFLWNGQRKATNDFFKEINVTYNLIDIGNNQTAVIIKK